jgi:mannose-6-phosphate isomerase-like protein (cupin superfamily)
MAQGYSVAEREDAVDFMAQYPGYGEMRLFTQPLGSEQVAFTWRKMSEGTGGKGSYGHRHKTQEEIYFVISGNVTFKCDDDVFVASPGTAVRLPPEVVRSVHNDGPGEAELIMCSRKVEDPEGDVETVEGFWATD